ncbi:MAG: hypothetical protein ABR526_04100 [Chthoniobacterales bacterium]
MIVPRRPVIILLGMMTRMPVGGVIWQTIQYLVGLRSLGFDVFYVEEHGAYPGMLAAPGDPDGAESAAAFIGKTMDRFDLGSSWCYQSWHDADRTYGLSAQAVKELFGRAAAVINLHGGTVPRAEHKTAGAFIYLETDPVAPQIELHNGVRATGEFLDVHTAYFTYGENIGQPGCAVPAPPSRYKFYPTRQPIVMGLWQNSIPAGDRFTTIANWHQPERQMTFNGEVYHWSKHYEFLKFIDLPQRTAQPFELALSSYAPADEEMLRGKGWHVSRALDFSLDPDRYRDFILQSRGEWTVAKDQNVRLRSGWFSDRAASYLAAGRPVVTQETGFSDVLPTGDGLFAFTTMDETVAAIDTINGAYAHHARAATELAHEHFSHDVVLPALLEQAGVRLPHSRS